MKSSLGKVLGQFTNFSTNLRRGVNIQLKQKKSEIFNMAEEIRKMVEMQSQMTGILQGVAEILGNLNNSTIGRNTSSAQPTVQQHPNVEHDYNDSCQGQHFTNTGRSSQTEQQQYPSKCRLRDRIEVYHVPRRRSMVFQNQASHQQTPDRPTHPVRNINLDPYQADSSNSDGMMRTRIRRDYHHNRSQIKIPTFYGKEYWQVWINRFESVAERQGWTSFLPKLKGSAGDFVFTQLRRDVLNDNKALATELD